MRRPGFVVGITLESEAAANAFIERCPAIFPSTSFGAVHTSAERRARWGDAVAPGYVRLSAGCEPTAPLLASIQETLDDL
jgi:cystathionine gamma-lyase